MDIKLTEEDYEQADKDYCNQEGESLQPIEYFIARQYGRKISLELSRIADKRKTPASGDEYYRIDKADFDALMKELGE
jgi:hypothetical protein